MNDALRNLIWERDKGKCQGCGKELTMKINPYDDILSQFLDLKEIKIFKWERPCWKCDNTTSIVTYDLEVGYDFHIGSITKLDKLLMERYPSVKNVFSKTMEENTIANVCVKCGMLQGNWFIMEELLEMKNDGVDFEKLVDAVIPNTFDFKDFYGDEEFETYEERLSSGHIHHKDRNRDNNEPGNLILLCRDCHFKNHRK